MSGKWYTDEFNIEVVRQLTTRDYSVADVARRLGITTHSLAALRAKFDKPDVVRRPELDDFVITGCRHIKHRHLRTDARVYRVEHASAHHVGRDVIAYEQIVRRRAGGALRSVFRFIFQGDGFSVWAGFCLCWQGGAMAHGRSSLLRIIECSAMVLMGMQKRATRCADWVSASCLCCLFVATVGFPSRIARTLPPPTQVVPTTAMSPGSAAWQSSGCLAGYRNRPREPRAARHAGSAREPRA